MIKNLVFDIGNVLVKWDPKEVITKTFPQEKSIANLANKIFKNPIWYDLNLGKITEDEAIAKYSDAFNIKKSKFELLMINVKVTQLPLPGSFELLKKAYNKGYQLYALTDNIREIMSYLEDKYDFWQYFTGVICSAEVGFLKPSKEIYQYLIDTYNLKPSETLFLDDTNKNVEGAKAVGISAIKFTNADLCKKDLKAFKISL